CYEEGLLLSPLNATSNGVESFNHLLYVDFTDSYRAKYEDYYNRYLGGLSKFNRQNMNENDRISYDVLKWQLEINLEGLSYKTNYIPFNQFYGMPLTIAQLGSGTVIQPFKTVTDYDDW